MKMTFFTLLILWVSGACSDSHTLRYHYTAASDKESGLPEFSAVGYVDDREILNYNSKSQLAYPVAQWMKNEKPDFWDSETQKFKGTESICKHNLRTTLSDSNQTKGIHFIQVIYVCELRDDSSTAGYCQIGYDGRDFAYLDMERGIYVPAGNEALVMTQDWNNPEVRIGERRKNYLETVCIEELKKYIEYGREDLNMRVRPEVKVWDRHQSDGVTRLQCLVYGFYPRDVHVKWVRNGVDDVPSDEMSPILPHPDGTYQIRVSVEVPTRNGDTYSCHVDHSSLQETLTVNWEPNYGSLFAIIVASAIGCLVIIVGVFLYKKRKGGYKTTKTSDTSSANSSNPET